MIAGRYAPSIVDFGISRFDHFHVGSLLLAIVPPQLRQLTTQYPTGTMQTRRDRTWRKTQSVSDVLVGAVFDLSKQKYRAKIRVERLNGLTQRLARFQSLEPAFGMEL
jgi:hypothetical protein